MDMAALVTEVEAAGFTISRIEDHGETFALTINPGNEATLSSYWNVPDSWTPRFIAQLRDIAS